MAIFELQDRRTFGFSAENPTGERGGGSRGTDEQKLRPCVQLAPGETITLCDTDGPGMITAIWCTGYVGHSFILRIYWDNMERPSVESPICAFFGCAYDETPADRDGRYPSFSSAKMLIAPGKGYNCYWEMPFRSHCRVTVENRGESAQSLYYMISGWYGEIPDRSAYFHAAYRQEHPVQKGSAYTVLDGVTGRGCFAGVALAVGLNGANTCWVEGETKMYLDGDRYPTVNYTGTEDYFGGSYGFGNDILLNKYQTYAGLYAGLYAILGDTREMYNGQQRFLLYRWHVPDPVYFAHDFKMTMQNLGWTGPRYDDYTSVAYYYLEHPAAVPHPLPTDRELVMR